MELYSQTLVHGGGAVSAISGSFCSDANQAGGGQEVLINHGTWLELVLIDSSGTPATLCRSEAFAVIRSICPLRISGSQRDYIAVGSDSGKLSILEYNKTQRKLTLVKCETFGKSGVRRVIPGQYLAVDPAGRCLMIAALEKQKLVFNVARDNEGSLVVASPLEAHKQNTLVFDIQALHVGLENPIFATIEVDYSKSPNSQRAVVLYEVEEGLNHVVRKSIQDTFSTANIIIPVPLDDDAPGGFFVCGEGCIEYQSVGQDPKTEPAMSVLVPRRVDIPENRGTLVSCFGVLHRKTKSGVTLLILLQTEYGDIFKLSCLVEAGKMKGFELKYFDTCPVARSLCITKRGFLFLASEFGDHRCYRLASLGDDDKATLVIKSQNQFNKASVFAPRRLENLSVTSVIESLAPAICLQVAEVFGEPQNQILIGCGRGARSALKIVRYGLKASDIAVTALGGTPSAVWTVLGEDFKHGKYIVITFSNVTTVLAVGDNTVEQVLDSGLLTNAKTLAVRRLKDGSIAQIHPGGIHRTNGKEEWKVPTGKSIECAALNESQIAVALAGGQVLYFEFNDSGSLSQSSFSLDEDLKCLSIGELPVGRQRAPYLAAGTYSNTLHIFDLNPATSPRFKQVTIQALPDQATSLLLCYTDSPQVDGRVELNLYAGLRNGVLVSSRLDEHTGALVTTRSTVLGSKPVICTLVTLPREPAGASGDEDIQNTQNAVLALSSRSWLLYVYERNRRVVPLSYEPLTFGSRFSSSICDGVVAVSGDKLRIFEVEDVFHTFNSKTIKLEMTPRALLVTQQKETGYCWKEITNVPVKSERSLIWKSLMELHDHQYDNKKGNADVDMDQSSDIEHDEDELEEKPPLSVAEVGLPKIGFESDGYWASLIRLLDPRSGKSLAYVEMEPNVLAVGATLSKLGSSGEEFLIVGTVTGMTLHPQSHEQASIQLYRITESSVTLLHSTPVHEGIPRALCGIGNVIAVGVGNSIKIYSLGKNRLLLKTEMRNLPSSASFIRSIGDRLFVGDTHESVHIYRLSSSDFSLTHFADDRIPRLCVAGEILDYDTIGASDKFGNMFVLRLPSDVDDADVDRLTGDRVLWDQGKNSGAPNKFGQICQFYKGEVISSMRKCAITPDKATALVYCTTMGSIGYFHPFSSKDEHESFALLESHLRASPELAGLAGRNHLPYRSAFGPVKGVTDGDLCCLFKDLSFERQKEISEELGKPPKTSVGSWMISVAGSCKP